MKILDRFLQTFGLRRHSLIGAISQPTDLMASIYAVRARAYLKITGKQLVDPAAALKLKSIDSVDSLTDNLSPSRRLARRGL